ncbi:hypothetical protein HPP92_012155 [Vanilla planifolia]|uniref:DYW domain-containing protein n=1 Tax=Vanilla planifolia TaxID=51239 RepID=A0A835R1Z0_VANPL|nr:hypothetical protein HPP92_012155 [Vanilla planifolia]
MRKNGVQPTDITFIGILNACNHAGLVTEGREIFSSIEKNYGISPTIEHYGCIVDLLGRAGFVEEGFNIVHSMAMKPDPVLWTSLLAACRLHKNMELAERIADFMVNKGLANSGTFVLLSNIYADIGRRLESPKSKEIYAMTEELDGLFRAHGYAPQTELVLHDLEESEKRRALAVHSEKLAIAFGLISTRPGTTMRS